MASPFTKVLTGKAGTLSREPVGNDSAHGDSARFFGRYFHLHNAPGGRRKSVRYRTVNAFGIGDA